MRLSDLMKNKGHVPLDKARGRQDKSIDSAQGEPSQKPVEEKPAESRETSPRQPTLPTHAPLGTTKKLPPDSGRPQQQGDKVESVPPYAIPSEAKSTGKDSMYDSLPSGIYQAAEQLKITVPQNNQATLQKARTSLANVIAKAVDPTAEKGGLWETTRKIANDLSVIIALDSNFAQMTQRWDTTTAENCIRYHSINTAVIAIDLAKHIEKTEQSPQQIGAAALLHDVGVPALGLDLASDEKNPIYKEHVAKSVEILEEMKVPNIIRTMVAQHHERLDGKGYPAGISGNEFLVSSQILSLSNGFRHIMCGCFHDTRSQDSPQENYVQTTLTKFREAIAPDILKAFISLRGFYPNAAMVELTNRSICRVVKQNEGFPLRPVVLTVMDSAGNHSEDAKIIDLRTTTTLSIIRLISHG